MIWQTLLVQHGSADTISTAISAWLKAQGYKTYDPFPGGLGAPFGKVSRTRMFLSPSQNDWQRLYISPQDTLPDGFVDALNAGLPSTSTLLWLQMPTDEQFAVQMVGAADEWASFAELLRDGIMLENLAAAANQTVTIAPPDDSNLPLEIQQMAEDQGVQTAQVNKLMGKMSRRIFKKAAKQDQDANLDDAQAALSNQQGVNWQSVAGQRLQAVMDCLVVPENFWREPDWTALTGAYQVARQLQRGKDMMLPGDEERLSAVPDALEYDLLYFSKKI